MDTTGRNPVLLAKVKDKGHKSIQSVKKLLIKRFKGRMTAMQAFLMIANKEMLYSTSCCIILETKIVWTMTGLSVFKHDSITVVGLATHYSKTIIIT